MKIAIIDKIGLCYDGNTLHKRGLGGSESAVIYIARSLAQTGFDVTVFNNSLDKTESSPGLYDGVNYVDNSESDFYKDEVYDVVIVSRTIEPFISDQYKFIEKSKLKILWAHDTFIQGDHLVEELLISKRIDYLFTLSDFHTNYVLNCDHGNRRNFEVLKNKIFQTRNGAMCYNDEVDLSLKDKNHFIYNASATKGLKPLLELIWPNIKANIPEAHLTVVGGYYRFRSDAAPDAQEETVNEYKARDDLKKLDVTFTGVITQKEIGTLLSNAYMMLYPTEFPETFGISTLESLLYKTPVITSRFGALEETAIEDACYLIDYSTTPNVYKQNIDVNHQVKLFLEQFYYAYNNPYVHQQKQYACDVVKQVASWDTIAKQWKQFFYNKLGLYLPVKEYEEITKINHNVMRIFNRKNNYSPYKEYVSFGKEKHICVIMPFYNAENYLEQAIDSVLTQSYNNYTIILVDDASNDDSYNVILKTLRKYSSEINNKIKLVINEKNKGAVRNQYEQIIDQTDDSIIMLIDGDDSLVNNNTIFNFYNTLFDDYDFTYGSCLSLADNLKLIAQDYPKKIHDKKKYREHLFNWNIPYTHLRAFRKKLINSIDIDLLKSNDEFMKAGADGALFYALIEKTDPNKIKAVKEVIYNYNDLNPLNDYKVNSNEQTKNANKIIKKENKVKKILVAIPTNKYVEVETFKSLWDLIVPEGYELDFQYFYGYQIDQIRNLVAEWAKSYDYLFSLDSDIILPKDALVKMIAANKDIISGLYIQRKPDQHILEIYMDHNGSIVNIPWNMIKNIHEPFEVAAVGMGCCLIKSFVMQNLEYPHFYYTSALDHANTVSEDVYFCMKARKGGYKVWVDSSICCDHKGSTYFKVKDDVAEYINDVANQDLLPLPQAKILDDLKEKLKIETIYDIGSCVLHWERHAKRVWPDSKIILFEANPLVKRLYDEKGIKDYFIGVLSDTDGKIVEFYLNPYNLGGNSYYKENTEHFNETHIQKFTTYRLDSLVESNNIPYPDLIKIDVQGAELDILKGAKNSIRNAKAIIVECQKDGQEYNLGAPKFSDIEKFLGECDFKFDRIINMTEVDGDYLFLKI